MTYVEQKLAQAVDCLDGDGDLRDRLRLVATYCLTGLVPAHFTDPAIMKEWRAIWEDLCVDDPQWDGEGNFDATTRNLIPFWARDIEKRIRELHIKVWQD
jgi:hypothetical protein